MEVNKLMKDAKDIADTVTFPALKIILQGNGGVSKIVELTGLDAYKIRLRIKQEIFEKIGRLDVGGTYQQEDKTEHIINFE
nr:hypothetical protein [uncultured Prevotella sp.]